jgi:hypothetical protein
VRPGDEKAAIVLAMQEELTALGLLPQPEGAPERKVVKLASAGHVGTWGKPCGTEAAYRRHLRHGEQPCEACTKATRTGWKARTKPGRAA